MEPAGTDPGWPPPLPAFLRVLVAILGLRRRPAVDTSILSMLRSVFLGFVEAAVVMGIAVVAIEVFADLDASMSTGPALLGVAAAGTCALAVGSQVRKNLDWTGDDPLARSFATRFFIRVGAADACVITGLIGYLLTSSIAPFALGALFSVIGFVKAAPTAAQIEDDQVSTRPTGSNRRLLDALLAPPPT